MNSNIIVRKATLNDIDGVYDVYKQSSEAHPETLTQYSNELTKEYITSEVKNALERGLFLIAYSNNTITGSFKAYTSKYKKLAHIMTNGTFTAMPTYEGKRSFVLLLKAFLKELSENYKYIYKLEGVPHETNMDLINYYLGFNFVIEGRIKNKIFNSTTNSFNDEIIISWKNPNFDFNELKKYQEKLQKIYNF